MTTLAPRSLGPARLSPIAFGSMRLGERSLDDEEWGRLFARSLELGVTTYHSSVEYESYPRFCRLIAGSSPALRGRIQHIVKLAEPHFQDLVFSAAKLTEKVEAYLRELGAERLDVVQWMWRGDLKDEPARLAAFVSQRDEVLDTFASLRRTGKLGAVAPFPYTIGFADRVLDGRGGFDGLTVYLNPVEREMVPQIEAAAAQGLGAVAIRPLAAGKALEAHAPADCLRSVLAQAGVATAVVSYSTTEHLLELAAAAQ